MTTTQEATHSQDGERSRRAAAAALEGLNQFDVATTHTVAKVSAVLSVSSELADTNDRILSATIDLGRIANAVEAANDRGADCIGSELTVVRGEIARTDTKASILLASVAILAGPLAERADALLHQPWPIAALGVVAAVLAGAAAWLLLDVVLPRLTGSTGFRSNSYFVDLLFQRRQAVSTTATFLGYARCEDADGIRAAVETVDRYAELGALSRIAAAKFKALGTAGRLLKASGLLLAVTAGLAIAF
ncbi:hypothetical protein [Streptomyces goshikiensis]|uniref:hypothetical protein n=1 Tax=Streptomyces goshikiensis TaxID=1942 RepID=UPI0036674B52